MTVYVLEWAYFDHSSAGVVDVFMDEVLATRVKDVLVEHGQDKIFRVTPKEVITAQMERA